VLPQSQKHILVTARLKKHVEDINSYGPISNLYFLSKLVERAVASRFVGHCESNSIFSVRQSANRKCHSTETAVTIVYNDVVCANDRVQLTVLVLLDLSSAFDAVDHSCLILVLCQRFNIEGLASGQFTSYLSGHSQTLCTCNSQSVPIVIESSVPPLADPIGPI